MSLIKFVSEKVDLIIGKRAILTPLVQLSDIENKKVYEDAVMEVQLARLTSIFVDSLRSMVMDPESAEQTLQAIEKYGAEATLSVEQVEHVQESFPLANFDMLRSSGFSKSHYYRLCVPEITIEQLANKLAQDHLDQH